MRLFSTLLLSAAVTASAFASEATFERVWPQWRDANAFDRIREYFGGPENDGRETVVRTHAGQRAGLYFVVRVNSAAAINGGKFVLQLIRPDSPDIRSYTFPVSLAARSHVAELGLTDGDWPGGREAHPVAWKLTLVAADGRVLAADHSFLWQEPAS